MPSAGHVPFIQSLVCREVAGEDFDVDGDPNGFPIYTFTPATIITNVLQSLSSFNDAQWQLLYRIPEDVRDLAAELNNTALYHLLERNFSSVAEAVTYLAVPDIAVPLNTSDLHKTLANLNLSPADLDALSSASINWFEVYRHVGANSAAAAASNASSSSSSSTSADIATSFCKGLSSVSPLVASACNLGLASSSLLLPLSSLGTQQLPETDNSPFNAEQLNSLLQSVNVSAALQPVLCNREQFNDAFSFPSTLSASNRTALRKDLCHLSSAQRIEFFSALIKSPSGEWLTNFTLTPEKRKLLSLAIKLSQDAQFLSAVSTKLSEDNIDLRPLAMFYGYFIGSPVADYNTQQGRQVFVRHLGAFFCGDNFPRFDGPPDNMFALQIFLHFLSSDRQARAPTNTSSEQGGSVSDETEDKGSPSTGGSVDASDIQIQNEIINELIARAANGRLRLLFAPDNHLTGEIVKKIIEPFDDFKSFVSIANTSYWQLSQSWHPALTALNTSLTSDAAVDFLTDFCPTVEYFLNMSDPRAAAHRLKPHGNSGMLVPDFNASSRNGLGGLVNFTSGVFYNASQFSNDTAANSSSNRLASQWQAYVEQFCDDLRLLRLLLGQDTLVPGGLVVNVRGLYLTNYSALLPNQTLFADLDDMDEFVTAAVNSSMSIDASRWWMGAKDEAELESIAANAWDYNLTTLAGIVFTNLYTNDTSSAKNTTTTSTTTTSTPAVTTTLPSLHTEPSSNVTATLPPHIIYKLRQNSSMVTSTQWIHSLYWTPGPCLTLFCRRYELFGFLAVQDLVDKAIVDLQTNHANASDGSERSQADTSSPGPSERDNFVRAAKTSGPSTTGYLGSWLQNFPYQCHLYDEFTTMSAVILPLAMFLSFLFSVAMLVKNIVYEKEQRLKEVMKVMGMTNTIHWLAWLITSVISLLIPVTLLSIILKYGKVMTYSNIIIIWLYLLLFAISCISFSFLISVFFSRANLAAACAGVFFFVAFFPYMALFIRQSSVTYWSKAISCLMSPTAFSFATQYVTYYEQQQKGLQWNNLASSPLTGDLFNFQQCMLYLAMDCVIYFALAWYLDHVLPGRYGVPRPWYFLFQISFWMGDEWVARRKLKRMSTRSMSVALNAGNAGSRSSYSTTTRDDAELQISAVDDNNAAADDDDDRANLIIRDGSASVLSCEEEPDDVQCGVDVRNLTKVYTGSKHKAVDGLSVKFYQGQITSFLGHNGAGKTTTMSILTGLHRPSSGTILVHGKDIRTDLDSVRHSLGFCPQHNVLFDRLTVEEHILFYAQIKRVLLKEIQENMTKWLEEVGLLDKRHCLARNLSGGMKRKLSVAIAFIGGSLTVVLDEPTAGIDPYSRRSIWDLLVHYRKQGRTIILSTHHMDEADVLGDRIAIIARGKLRCVGSSIFLKSKYGHGYSLTLVKISEDVTAGLHSSEASRTQILPDPMLTENHRPACDEDRLTAFIREHVNCAKLLRSTVEEVVFQLPASGAQDGSFQRLFSALDDNLPRLGVRSYGLTDTSLEEVFMKISSGEDLDVMDVVGKSRLRNAMSHIPCLRCCTHDNDSSNGSPVLPAPSHDSTAAHTNGNLAMPPATTRNTSAASSMMMVVNGAGADSVTGLSDGSLGPDTLVDSGWHSANGEVLLSDQQQEENVNQLGVEACLSEITLNPVSIVGGTGAQLGATDSSSTCQQLSSHPAKQLAWQQFKALFSKRFHHAKRNWKGFFAQVVVPAILVAMALLNVIDLEAPADDTPLTLLPSVFTEDKFTPTRAQNSSSAIAVRAALSLDHPCGLSTEHFWQGGSFNTSHSCYDYSASSVDGVSPLLTQDDIDNNNTYIAYKGADASDIAYTNTGVFTPSYYGRPIVFTRHEFEEGFNLSNPDDCIDCRWYPWLCEHVPDTLGRTTVVGDSVLESLDRQSINLENWILKTNSHYVLKRWGAVSFGSQVLTVVDSRTRYRFVNALARKPANLGWNNLDGYHAAPIYMNVLTNSLLRAGLNNTQDPVSFGVTTINHPFAKTVLQLNTEYTQSGIQLINAIFVILALSFVPASFVLYLIGERASGSKHLQRMTGVSGLTYWTSTFIWDMVNYLVTVVTLLIVFAIFGSGVYTSAENFPATIALLLLYGWSITPLMYPFSFYFEVPSTAYVILLCGNVAIGAFGTIATFFLQLFPGSETLTVVNDHLRVILLIFPNFCVGRGMMDLAYLHYGRLIGKELGASWYTVRPSIGLGADQVGRNLLSMAVSGVFFFALTLAIEYGVFGKVRRWLYATYRSIKSHSASSSSSSSHTPSMSSLSLLSGLGGRSSVNTSLYRGLYDDDDDDDDDDNVNEGNGQSSVGGSQDSVLDKDVAEERQRVLSGNCENSLLLLKNLTKMYGEQRAVNEMCLGVEPGMCFGLLGVNGAGKTSTFKMLTGEVDITSGEAFLGGLSVVHDTMAVRRLTGYCPQFDALDELLTAREHLHLYARLRGVDQEKCAETVDWTIKNLQLTRYADEVVAGYSGGNKRKLSTAIALIGRPPVIFLDEPTTGMDVKARRFLWSVIQGLTHAGHCVILTSHSMEECESLCHRLAIMVNGELRCLGSPQHLKSRFGDGYTLTIRLKTDCADGDAADSRDQIKEFCRHRLRNIELLNEQCNLLVHQVPADSVQSLSEVFAMLESMRCDYPLIQDYSLSQTSLDEVFIRFAKHQLEADRVRADEERALTASGRMPSGQSTHRHSNGGAQGRGRRRRQHPAMLYSRSSDAVQVVTSYAPHGDGCQEEHVYV
eukprot:scpid17073/ scgid34952/ Retinal-specific ATP-binding cassette transporter; ATP-binding cassette sub-family A member 4; RIM ABC transporter; Stargardt disease protein